MHRIRNKFTYANVMSSLAVFLVLGGATAFAATQLGRNSVGTEQLKSNAVTTGKIKRNAVIATKIKAGSITPAKIKNGAVTAAKIKTGAISANQLGTDSVGNAQTQQVKVFKAGAVSAAASEAAAPKTDLGTVGPFHFYGKCFKEGALVIERTYIEVTSGSAALGRATKEPQAYLTPATPEGRRSLNSSSTEANEFSVAVAAPFEAAATDGTVITGIAAGGAVKQGAPAEGSGPFLAGDSCIVGTTVIFGGK